MKSRASRSSSSSSSLIVGILAAIALPTFLGQQKGQDASAKSDVRNAVSQIESCFVDTQDYAGCDTKAEVPQRRNGVTVTSSTPSGGYAVSETSKSANVFNILKNTDGSTSRTCTGSGGGCNSGSW